VGNDVIRWKGNDAHMKFAISFFISWGAERIFKMSDVSDFRIKLHRQLMDKLDAEPDKIRSIHKILEKMDHLSLDVVISTDAGDEGERTCENLFVLVRDNLYKDSDFLAQDGEIDNTDEFGIYIHMWIRTFRFFEFVLHQEVQLTDHATLYGTISESADIDKYICLDKEERRRLHLLWNLSK